MVGCVAAGAPLLAVPSLTGGDGVDDAAVAFLVQVALQQKKEVEEKVKTEMSGFWARAYIRRKKRRRKKKLNKLRALLVDAAGPPPLLVSGLVERVVPAWRRTAQGGLFWPRMRAGLRRLWTVRFLLVFSTTGTLTCT